MRLHHLGCTRITPASINEHIPDLHAATSTSNLSPFAVRVSQAIIMNLGTEWLVDAEGCSADLLRDVEVVRSICDEVVATLELRVIGGPSWHQFPQPGGVTGLYLLTESHLACHTFPETGLATFNLYCCRPRPAFEWEARLKQLLCAAQVTVRAAARGSEAMRGSVVTGDALLEANVSGLTAVREVTSR